MVALREEHRACHPIGTTEKEEQVATATAERATEVVVKDVAETAKSEAPATVEGQGLTGEARAWNSQAVID
jgi:hypothetical protein